MPERSIIVLGAGMGMGRQVSHALAQAGARVVCVDIDAERADTVAAEVGGLGLAADVTDPAELDRVVDRAMDTNGRIDGLVDIVGMAQWSSLLDLDIAVFQRQLELNLHHAFYGIQAVGSAMVEAGNGGSMTFIASVSGFSGAPNHAAYGSAKAGLMALIQSAALELASAGVRVNAVAPGTTRTPRTAASSTPERVAAMERTVPLGRLGSTADIAAAVLFLMSDLAGHITGQTLVVDGGVSTKFRYLPD